MKILVIGCGSIGARHARIIVESGRHEVAICDSSKDMTDALAAQLGIGEVYADYKQALDKSGADAVIVCTPNHLHFAPTVEALSRGMHVLCEKPSSDKQAEAKAMYEAAEKAGRTLMVGYTTRMSKTVDIVKNLIDSGEMGRVSSARVILAAPETLRFAKTPYRNSYETGGGIMYDYSHEIDYCRYFFGEADKCVAFVDKLFPYLETCDDNAAMLIKYKSGITLTCHMDYVQEVGPGRGRGIGIIMEKGFIETNFSTMLSIYHDSGDVENHTYNFERDNLFREQLSRFERVIAGEKLNYSTGYDAYQVIRVCDELYNSARTGRVITL